MEKLFFGSIQSEDVKIHYSRTSQGFPPVVMLHGLFDNGLCFGRLAYSFYTMYDVILPDARGHGLSDAPGHGYDLHTFAGDVRQLVASLALDQPIVLGHSMGAAAAARFAAEYPESIRALILIDPPWVEPGSAGVDFERHQEMFLERMRLFRPMSFAEVETVGRQEHPSWHADDLDQWCKAKSQAKEESVTVIRSIAEAWLPVADKIQCKTLVLTGDPEKGALISSGTAALLKERYPNWTVVRIPEAGHNVQRDAFEQSKNQILDFLRTLD